MPSLVRIALVCSIVLIEGEALADIKLAFDSLYQQSMPYAITDFREAYARIGVEVSIEILPGRRAIAMANLGEYQALDARYLGSESLSNMLPVMVPIYWEFQTFACGLIGNDIFIQVMDDLHQYAVVGVRGNTYNLTLQKQFPTLDLVRDEETAVMMVESKRADLALMTAAGLARWQAAGLAVNMEKKSDMLYNKRLYHHIHKSHADLIPKLGAVIKAMKAEGKFITRE